MCPAGWACGPRVDDILTELGHMSYYRECVEPTQIAEEDKMAVARIDPVRVRRFDPAVLRGKPVERRVRVPRRALVVGAILTGGLVQHVLATTPAEPQPTPLAVVAAAAVPPRPQALRAPTRAHGRAGSLGPAPHHHPSARPAPAVGRRATRPVAAGHARTVAVQPRTPGRAPATARLARPAPPSGSCRRSVPRVMPC